MGTLSKRRIEDFGIDVVGKKLEGLVSHLGATRAPGTAVARGFAKIAGVLPPGGWLALAGATAISSLGMRLARRSTSAAFFAAWVPALLVLGIYPRTTAPEVDSEHLH